MPGKRSTLLPLLLVGCTCPDLVDRSEPEPRVDRRCSQAELRSVGPGPFDGFQLATGPSGCDADALREDCVAVLVDEDGARVQAEPFGVCGRWRAAEGFPSGTYAFEALSASSYEDTGLPPVDWQLGGEHVVGHWGRDPAFEPRTVAHSDWQLDVEDLHSCAFGGYLDTVLQAVGWGWPWVRLGQARGGRVELQVIRADGIPAAEPCVAFEGLAWLSGTGQLRFEPASLDLRNDPSTLGWDLRMDAAFDAEAQLAKGLAFEGTVDISGLHTIIDEVDDSEELCSLFGSFGMPCSDCPDGSSSSCVQPEIYAGHMHRADGVLPPDLPSCAEPDPDSGI